MNRTPTLEAKANAAFQRYAEAHARMHATARPEDRTAARRAYRAFLAAYLTPDERAGLGRIPLSPVGGH